MDPLTLSVYIWMYFQNLRLGDPRIMQDILIDFSALAGNDTSVFLGTLKLENGNIEGFSTLPTDSPSVTPSSDNIVVTEDVDGNNNVCLKNVLLDRIHASGEYDSDIGILDKIPIYGKGSFTFGLRDISMELCTYVNWKLSKVEDFKVVISYRHQPITISGFWKNEEFSIFLSKMLTSAHKMFAMWNAYDPQCASCVLSPILEYLMNVLVMKYPDSTLNFGSCSCAKEIMKSINLERLTEDDVKIFEILVNTVTVLWEMDTANELDTTELELMETVENLFMAVREHAYIH